MLSFETTTPGGPLAAVESEIPQPQWSEVIVKILACGVCHSDTVSYTHLTLPTKA